MGDISQFLQLITTLCCSDPYDDDPMGLEAVDPGDATYHFGDDTLEEIHRYIFILNIYYLV